MNDDTQLTKSFTVRDVKRRILDHYSDYFGLAELSSALGLSKSTTNNWRNQGKIPEPYQQLRSGPVWSRATLLTWLNS